MKKKAIPKSGKVSELIIDFLIYQKIFDIGLMSKDTVVMRTKHIISLISRVRDKANRLIIG